VSAVALEKKIPISTMMDGLVVIVIAIPLNETNPTMK
jgi:hypothetical protein